MQARNPDAAPDTSPTTVALDDGQNALDATVPGETLNATLAPGERPFGLETPDEQYNPEQSRDKARATITYWLLGLLTFLFVGAFIAFFASSERTFANLKVMLEMLISPLIVLVSAATGFYFGAHSANKK